MLGHSSNPVIPITTPLASVRKRTVSGGVSLINSSCRPRRLGKDTAMSMPFVSVTMLQALFGQLLQEEPIEEHDPETAVESARRAGYRRGPSGASIVHGLVGASILENRRETAPDATSRTARGNLR